MSEEWFIYTDMGSWWLLYPPSCWTQSLPSNRSDCMKTECCMRCLGWSCYYLLLVYCCKQALVDDEMMRQYANLLLRQDTARAEALMAFQARTALRTEVAGSEVGRFRFLMASQSDFQSNVSCLVSAVGSHAADCVLR